MSDNSLTIFWFRQDLRLADNPALLQALAMPNVMVIYILDDINAGQFKMGGASRWWLHHSLSALNESLLNTLQLFEGNPEDILDTLTEQFNVTHLFWNRCYEPWKIKRDSHLKQRFRAEGIQVNSCNQSLLAEPWTILKPDGSPYKVFTPFWRKLSAHLKATDVTILPAPTHGSLSALTECHALPHLNTIKYYKQTLLSLHLLPSLPWADGFSAEANPGERNALQKSAEFIEQTLTNYASLRDFPAQSASSNLSAHIHFGEVSVRMLWQQAQQHSAIHHDNSAADAFVRQLGWREFSHALQYHWPDIATKPLKSKFDRLPYVDHCAHLTAWQQGITGFPLIDAGMKQLWQTGTMHNRVRMLTASFLVKQLLIDWRKGADWFWDCLLDANRANNAASWQWVAGCGTDAAPYFRIFNPTTQGEKFDKHGEYVKHYLPVLANLPDKYLFQPWAAPKAVLEKAGVKLGDNYPFPIVDLKDARMNALAAYDALISD